MCSTFVGRLDAINIFDGTLTALNVEVKEGTELYRVNASKDPQNPDMVLNNEFITDRAREVCSVPHRTGSGWWRPSSTGFPYDDMGMVCCPPIWHLQGLLPFTIPPPPPERNRCGWDRTALPQRRGQH